MFVRGNPGQLSTIVLSYKVIDALARAEIDVLEAERSVERINELIGRQESVIAVIGSVKEVVDVIVEVVDVVAEVRFFLIS